MATKKTLDKIRASYFTIPAVILFLSWLDGWFAYSNLAWVQKLKMYHFVPLPTIFVLWYAVLLCTTIAATLFWTQHSRNDLFKTVVSLMGINLFCFLVSHYLFYVTHQIGISLIFFLGVVATIWYTILLLWPKMRLIAALALPYGISALYSLYLVHAAWLLN